MQSEKRKTTAQKLKYFKFLVIIFSFTLLTFSLAPVAQAAPSWWPIVPCGLSENYPGTDYDESQPCGRCDIFKLFKNIIDFVLMGLMPPVAGILFVWAGFLILMGGANPGMFSQGRSIFWNTFIGILILLSSWLITNSILKSLATDDYSTEWWKLECREGAILTPTPTPTSAGTPTPTGTQPPTTGQPPGTTQPPTTSRPPTSGGVTYGTCSGVACRGDTTSVCGPVDPGDGCDASAVNNLDAAIVRGVGNRTICSGINTVKMLKTIIANESDGRIDIGSGDGQSAGPFQLTPETANRFRAACRVTEPIDFSWLRRANTVDAQACIAAEFIRSFVGSCGCDVRQIAAGYNGGPTACANSNACGQQAAANGGQCSACNVSRPTRKWECLWEDTQHNTCNKDRQGGGYSHTRIYAPRVEFCYNRF